jgi:hypothetical protein
VVHGNLRQAREYRIPFCWAAFARARLRRRDGPLFLTVHLRLRQQFFAASRTSALLSFVDLDKVEINLDFNPLRNHLPILHAGSISMSTASMAPDPGRIQRLFDLNVLRNAVLIDIKAEHHLPSIPLRERRRCIASSD